MSVVGDTRVLPEDLRETVARLRPIFERLSRQHEHDASNHEDAKTRRSHDIASCLRVFVVASLKIDDARSHHRSSTPSRKSDRAVRARGGRAASGGDRRVGRVPARCDARGGRARSARRRRFPTAWGGAGRDYVSYALAIEAIARASATVAVSLVVHQLARRRADRARRPRAAEGAVAPHARDRRGDRRLRAVGARRRHRRRQPADDRRAEERRRLPHQRTQGLGRQCGCRRRVAIVFARTRPGPARRRAITAFLVPMDTPGITRTARADSLGVRGLGCMDLELRRHGQREPGARARSIRASRWRCGRCEGGRVAIAAQALGIGEAATRRSDRLREDSAKRSASRSRTTRRFSGCWPTWPPNSRRRGC